MALSASEGSSSSTVVEQTPVSSVLLLMFVVIVVFGGQSRTVEGSIVQFDCETMLPGGRRIDEQQTMIAPSPIAVNIGRNYVEGVKYTPGKIVRVEFKVTGDSVSSVFCRASQVLMAEPLGVWASKSPDLLPYSCLRVDDALQSNNSKPISSGTVFNALWTPPPSPGNGNMEIVCAFVDGSNKFWIWNSFMLSEDEY